MFISVIFIFLTFPVLPQSKWIFFIILFIYTIGCFNLFVCVVCLSYKPTWPVCYRDAVVFHECWMESKPLKALKWNITQWWALLTQCFPLVLPPSGHYLFLEIKFHCNIVTLIHLWLNGRVEWMVMTEIIVCLQNLKYLLLAFYRRKLPISLF